MESPPNWSKVEKDPMFLMQFVCREYVRCLQKRFHQQDQVIHHKGRGFPLYVLMDEDTPVQRDQKEIATMLGIAPSTMTGALKRLEASGLIRKHLDPNDQRRKLIGLTDKGVAFIRSRHDIHKDLNAQAMAGMTPGEQDKFLAQLADIYTRLQAMADDAAATDGKTAPWNEESKTERGSIEERKDADRRKP